MDLLFDLFEWEEVLLVSPRSRLRPLLRSNLERLMQAVIEIVEVEEVIVVAVIPIVQAVVEGTDVVMMVVESESPVAIACMVEALPQ